jgi:hypothetical protein
MELLGKKETQSGSFRKDASMVEDTSDSKGVAMLGCASLGTDANEKVGEQSFEEGQVSANGQINVRVDRATRPTEFLQHGPVCY